jgi:hypothetical protein
MEGGASRFHTQTALRDSDSSTKQAYISITHKQNGLSAFFTII